MYWSTSLSKSVAVCLYTFVSSPVSVCISFYHYQYLYPFLYLFPIVLSIYLSIYLSSPLYCYLSCISNPTLVAISTGLLLYLSPYPSIYLSFCQSICLDTYIPVNPNLCPGGCGGQHQRRGGTQSGRAKGFWRGKSWVSLVVVSKICTHGFETTWHQLLFLMPTTTVPFSRSTWVEKETIWLVCLDLL